MSTTLTDAQRLVVNDAKRFLDTPRGQIPAAMDLGAAVVHIQRLLNVIDDLTGSAS